jgi:hypothetical protein
MIYIAIPKLQLNDVLSYLYPLEIEKVRAQI